MSLDAIVEGTAEFAYAHPVLAVGAAIVLIGATRFGLRKLMGKT